MPKLTRRSALAALAPVVGVGAAAKLSGLAPGALAASENGNGMDGMPHGGAPGANGDVHERFGFRRGATVDHEANGFDPTEVLRDFDRGKTRRLASGRVVREWELVAHDKEIEVAPGVKFAGLDLQRPRPGPDAARARGRAAADPLRQRLRAPAHDPLPRHPPGRLMDGMPGPRRRADPARRARRPTSSTPSPFGLHLYHCHVVAAGRAHRQGPLRRVHHRPASRAAPRPTSW